LPGAITDPYSSWIYVRYLMSTEDVQAAHDGGKKVIASGPDVMKDLDNMVTSAEVGADTIMAYHPEALAQRLA